MLPNKHCTGFVWNAYLYFIFLHKIHYEKKCFKRRWSTIPTISTRLTSTSRLKTLNAKKITTNAGKKAGPGIGTGTKI